jgi:hypothetical protein
MQIPTDAELLGSINAFIVRHDMAPTRFGREATGEPQLIASIEGGRSPSLKVLQKIAAFMARYDAEAARPSMGNADENSPVGVAA